MSAMRRLVLVGLALVVVAGLFFFVQLGDDESEDTSDKPTPAASEAAADVDDDVAELFETAQAYALDQDAVSIAIEPVPGGTADGSAFNLSFVGDDAAGSFSSQGIAVDLRRIDGVDYIRGPEQFWAGSQTLAVSAAQLADKWVLVESAGQEFTPYQQYVDRAAFIQGILTPTPDMRAAGPSDDLGVPSETVTLATETGESVLHFDPSTGAPLAFVSAADTLRFDFADVAAPTKPADADIVDATTLNP